MDKKQEITQLEKRIEELKQEVAQDNFDKIGTLSDSLNFYQQYNEDMELITGDFQDYRKFETIMEYGYIKVDEYLNYLDNEPKTTIDNKIEELKESLLKQEELLKNQEFNGYHISSNDYDIVDNLRHDIQLLKSLK